MAKRLVFQYILAFLWAASFGFVFGCVSWLMVSVGLLFKFDTLSGLEHVVSVTAIVCGVAGAIWRFSGAFVLIQKTGKFTP